MARTVEQLIQQALGNQYWQLIVMQAEVEHLREQVRTMKTVDIPPSDPPSSALDRISLMAIDTDPDSNLALVIAGAEKAKLRVLAVVPHQFTEFTRGYLVVLQKIE
jgi:hypothetical protein